MPLTDERRLGDDGLRALKTAVRLALVDWMKVEDVADQVFGKNRPDQTHTITRSVLHILQRDGEVVQSRRFWARHDRAAADEEDD